MEQRLSIITLGVNDLASMTHFYEHSLGWKKMDSSNEHISFFKLNGFLFSLYPMDKLAEDAKVTPEVRGFKNFTLTYNVRSIQEVDDLFEAFEGKGINIIKPPETVFWGGYSGYIADIENNLWEIAYNPFMEMDAEGNVIA